jgi:hypothetical protein
MVLRGLENKISGNENRHFAGRLWWNSTEEATWVSYYNAHFREIAKLYGDVVMPFYDASHTVLDYFTEKDAVHSDAIHYCSGGLPRMANIVLHDTIEDAIKRKEGRMPTKKIVTSYKKRKTYKSKEE